MADRVPIGLTCEMEYGPIGPIDGKCVLHLVFTSTLRTLLLSLTFALLTSPKKSIKPFDLRYSGVENFAAVRKCQPDKAIFRLKWHGTAVEEQKGEKDIYTFGSACVNILWTHLASSAIFCRCIINSSSHMACILHDSRWPSAGFTSDRIKQ